MSNIAVDRRPSFVLPRSKGEVIEDLERRIATGEFPVGAKLPSERLLCEQYSVSRPVIREVLSGLAERGTVDILASRGSFVRGITTDELSSTLSRAASRAGMTARDLVTARLMLECFAAELAATSGTDESRTAITEALATHEAAVSLDERVGTDLAFHEAIAHASGNPVIALMFGSIRNHVWTLMYRSQSDSRVSSAGDPIHSRIASCIHQRDAQGARKAMSDHLELALILYGDDLDRPLTELGTFVRVPAGPLRPRS